MQTATEEHGRIFREAWIAGVRKHFPGEPKPGYVVPWDSTPGWERQAAAAVYEQVRQFIEISGGATAKLTRELKGRFVATCWIAQIHKHIPDPKPAYVADWDQLPTGSSKRTPTSSSTSSTNTQPGRNARPASVQVLLLGTSAPSALTFGGSVQLPHSIPDVSAEALRETIHKPLPRKRVYRAGLHP